MHFFMVCLPSKSGKSLSTTLISMITVSAAKRSGTSIWYNDVSIPPTPNLNVVSLGYVLTFPAKSILRLSKKQPTHTSVATFFGTFCV